jgi:hypothetical protein
MKPTERQIKAIESVESLCAIWKSSNDISSPSHYTLIDEEMQALEWDLNLQEDSTNELNNYLNAVLLEIKSL